MKTLEIKNKYKTKKIESQGEKYRKYVVIAKESDFQPSQSARKTTVLIENESKVPYVNLRKQCRSNAN